MKEVLLVRYGEIALKGLNRPVFEDKLIKNMRRAIADLGPAKIMKSQSRIYVEPDVEDYDIQEALERLVKVFGIVGVSRVRRVRSDMQVIIPSAIEVVRPIIERMGKASFKVETKRGDKRFPLESPEISKEVGAAVLRQFPGLRVDVSNPQFVLYLEVREESYLYSEIVPGCAGMPVGSNGKASLLLSGGIDSPVAGWMIAKRGVEIEAIHFYSYPYTSERAKEKVVDLAKILAGYTGRVRLHVVPFTEIQEEMNAHCPKEQLTIIMRRFMMRISERIASNTGSLALVTGECVGQVASQTLQSMQVTNMVTQLPVLRPLVGMDKNEVVEIARKIGTFETSILPYEDCCTVFVAKHPNTKPKLEKIVQSEMQLDVENLIQRAVEGVEVIDIQSY